MLIPFWNALKSAWSRVNDAIKAPEPRAPIPSFPTPENAATYLLAHSRYTGDPMGGAADFYLHPNRLQAAMNAGPEAIVRLAVDCDDYATWAHQALLTIPECAPQLFTLQDGNGWGHHVVCAYRWRTRCGVIDTNGHRILPDLRPETICSVFTALYASRGYRYVAAVPTPYPF